MAIPVVREQVDNGSPDGSRLHGNAREVIDGAGTATTLTTGQSGALCLFGTAPSIISTGAKQNVDHLPSTNDVVTVLGTASTTYQKNLMYHKDAFTFVTADLPIMDDGIRCVRRVQDGLSIRCWQGSDIRNDELLLRLDILYGYKTLRPEWACRITN